MPQVPSLPALTKLNVPAGACVTGHEPGGASIAPGPSGGVAGPASSGSLASDDVQGGPRSVAASGASTGPAPSRRRSQPPAHTIAASNATGPHLLHALTPRWYRGR